MSSEAAQTFIESAIPGSVPNSGQSTEESQQRGFDAYRTYTPTDDGKTYWYGEGSIESEDGDD